MATLLEERGREGEFEAGDLGGKEGEFEARESGASEILLVLVRCLVRK